MLEQHSELPVPKDISIHIEGRHASNNRREFWIEHAYDIDVDELDRMGHCAGVVWESFDDGPRYPIPVWALQGNSDSDSDDAFEPYTIGPQDYHARNGVLVDGRVDKVIGVDAYGWQTLHYDRAREEIVAKCVFSGTTSAVLHKATCDTDVTEAAVNVAGTLCFCTNAVVYADPDDDDTTWWVPGKVFIVFPGQSFATPVHLPELEDDYYDIESITVHPRTDTFSFAVTATGKANKLFVVQKDGTGGAVAVQRQPCISHIIDFVRPTGSRHAHMDIDGMSVCIDNMPNDEWGLDSRVVSVFPVPQTDDTPFENAFVYVDHRRKAADGVVAVRVFVDYNLRFAWLHVVSFFAGK